MINYNPYSLKGKLILITGASSGIGKATAIECSKLGAHIILTARNEKKLAETFSMLDTSEGQQHRIIVADLNNSNEINALVDNVQDLDGLVNNAGIVKTKPIQFIKEEELEEVFHINALASIMLTQKLFKKKKLKKNASVVFTSSIGGVFKVTPGNAMYGISKGAINSYMKSCALEFAPRHIRCNSVNPGMIETPLLSTSQTITAEDRNIDKEKYPLKRYGRPEEVAHAIIYLLSDASSWVTGHTLVIDGGITLK